MHFYKTNQFDKILGKTYEMRLLLKSISVISAGLQALNSGDFSRDAKFFFFKFSFFKDSISYNLMIKYLSKKLN